MKKSAIIISIGILSSIISLFCNSQKDPISANNTHFEIIPLKLNNQWEHQVTTFDSDGSPISFSSFSWTICCDTVYSGKTYYRYAGLFKNWFYNDNEGYWRVKQIPGEGFGQPELIYKYPCKKGDQFNDTVVLSTDTVITSQFGKLNCIFYRSPEPNHFITKIFAKPGIGEIKWIPIMNC